MKSFNQNFLDEQAIPLEVGGTLRILGEYRGRQELFARQSPQALDTLKQMAMIQSAESSNRIEGIIVQDNRLKALVEKKITPKDRPEAEVVGYRDILAQIHTRFESFPMTPETIMKIHGDMLRLTNLPAGDWKRKDNTIEERLPNGQWVTRFVPVSARETPYYIGELCTRFNRLWEEQRIDRLLLIHTFVLDFLCIHPFTDGNGRVSRLLTVLLLHQTGYDVGRYISLERLIEQSKETYYEVLQGVSKNWHEGRHRLLPWWRYCLGILMEAYKEFEDRVGKVRSSPGAKTAWVREAIDKLPVKFGVGELARACPGVSRPMIRVILEGLRKKGKIGVLSTGRGALWRKR